MAQINNLIEPGLEKIGLPGLESLFRPHGITLRRSPKAKRITPSRGDQFARKPIHKPLKPGNTNSCRRAKPALNQLLGYSSQATTY
ncbi:MAG: hypothetical protein ACREI9_14910, partial [Nitrospiraceae bacterium]